MRLLDQHIPSIPMTFFQKLFENRQYKIFCNLRRLQNKYKVMGLFQTIFVMVDICWGHGANIICKELRESLKWTEIFFLMHQELVNHAENFLNALQISEKLEKDLKATENFQVHWEFWNLSRISDTPMRDRV